jgi:glycosyltransferase involved in cell wall biosynthesis
MSAPALSIILPCRNQADHIGAVLRAYAEPLQSTGVPYELVVVPNACTDRTADVVREIAAGDNRIVVVESALGGWGRSVLAGLAAARGEILCYTNSARTDPQDIPPLLDLFRRHAPCVAKIRREQRGVFWRELGSWLYNCEARLLYGVGVGDVNGTPKILGRDVYRRLDLRSLGDLLDLELVAKVKRLGIPVVERPVSGFKRHGGRSSTRLSSAWRMYTGAVALRKTLAGFPADEPRGGA